MTAPERQASFSLALVFALRMLGLFLVLPVFMLEARQYPGGDDVALVGMAMGAYGLTQAFMQMPWSVPPTRKPSLKARSTISSSVNFKKDGTYTTNVTGQLEMHGVSKQISMPATVTVKGTMINAKAKFTILLADYNIQIPKVVADNISKTVRVEVSADYHPMNP